ncbi:MAG: hypothetical protein JO267_11800 [Alphaproteobacteria bacterium]|nr:hypothetical protein [Alphaproteobacteria bacterium]
MEARTPTPLGVPERHESDTPHRRTFFKLRPLLADAVAPLAAYYGLRSLGIADMPALLAGAGIVAADGLVSLAIERRIRLLPIVVCAMFALTGGLALAIHDARIILLKPSVITTALAIYLLTLSARQSVLYAALERLIARGSAGRAERWRQAWHEQPSLRRSIRVACLFAGVLMLAEAAARVAIVFSFGIAHSLVLVHVPGAILVVTLVLIVRFLVKPAVAGAMAERAREVPPGRR